MDEDFKALTEKLQKQVKENEKEAIGNLPNTLSSRAISKKKAGFSKGLLRK
jgi:hypothetical protein